MVIPKVDYHMSVIGISPPHNEYCDEAIAGREPRAWPERDPDIPVSSMQEHHNRNTTTAIRHVGRAIKFSHQVFR